MDEIYRNVRGGQKSGNRERQDGAESNEKYIGRSEAESLLIDFARVGIFDRNLIMSSYFWEARALVEGAALMHNDERKRALELAINIANVQNAKNPKRSVKSAEKAINKAENKITGNKPTTNSKPSLKALERLNKAFGGDS